MIAPVSAGNYRFLCVRQHIAGVHVTAKVNHAMDCNVSK